MHTRRMAHVLLPLRSVTKKQTYMLWSVYQHLPVLVWRIPCLLFSRPARASHSLCTCCGMAAFHFFIAYSGIFSHAWIKQVHAQPYLQETSTSNLYTNPWSTCLHAVTKQSA